jgi:energy-converting hydrogenase Eha subunit G
MGISVIAFIFAVVAFCLCKWGPERWGPSLFMVATGLMLAATPVGQDASVMIQDLFNNIFGGMFA